MSTPDRAAWPENDSQGGSVGEAVYVPSDGERRLLLEALDESVSDPGSLQDWAEVRKGFAG